jgi:hypothetical protein
LKQLHEDLKELGYEGSYDRVAAFARQWKAGQTEWVNSASKRTLAEIELLGMVTDASIDRLLQYCIEAVTDPEVIAIFVDFGRTIAHCLTPVRLRKSQTTVSNYKFLVSVLVRAALNKVFEGEIV